MKWASPLRLPLVNLRSCEANRQRFCFLSIWRWFDLSMISDWVTWMLWKSEDDRIKSCPPIHSNVQIITNQSNDTNYNIINFKRCVMWNVNCEDFCDIRTLRNSPFDAKYNFQYRSSNKIYWLRRNDCANNIKRLQKIAIIKEMKGYHKAIWSHTNDATLILNLIDQASRMSQWIFSCHRQVSSTEVA